MKYKAKRKSAILFFALVALVFVTQGIHHGYGQTAQPARAHIKDYKLVAPHGVRLVPRPLTGRYHVGRPVSLDFYILGVDSSPAEGLLLYFSLQNFSDGTPVNAVFEPPTATPRKDDGWVSAKVTIESAGVYTFVVKAAQLKIDHAFVNMRDYGTLTTGGGSSYTIGEGAAPGSTHTLEFAVQDAQQNPVPGLPLHFSVEALNNTAATAVFKPATPITDENGRLSTHITFGSAPGDLRLLIDIGTQKIVEMPDELRVTRSKETRVQKVTVQGIAHKFALIGSTRPLVFTATDPNGHPVAGEELTFEARSPQGSGATATFLPAVATTDQNGQARTQVTFGDTPGELQLSVQSGRIHAATLTEIGVNLGSQVNGEFTDLNPGDTLDLDSTHTLVFTARDRRGRPKRGLPIAFWAASPTLEPIFTPQTATTDRKGEARTQLTFAGQKPGDFQISVSMDPEQFIVFMKPELQLGDTDIATLEIEGMEEGFAKPGSSLNLVLTAKNARGRPVTGEQLTFGDAFGSSTLFKPAKVKTNNRGSAQTRVTLGPLPGLMGLIVSKPGSGSKFVSASFSLDPYGKVKSTNFASLPENFKVNATHDFVSTIVDGKGKPVPGLPLRLKAVGDPVIFKPGPQVTTDKNGRARWRVTLKDNPQGSFRIDVSVDAQRLIEIYKPNPRIFHSNNIARVRGAGIAHNYLVSDYFAHGFARTNSTRKLRFTALNKNGGPVKGVKLAFGFEKPPDSQATVIFDPPTATTNKNGVVETNATFGPQPGHIVHFTLQPAAPEILPKDGVVVSLGHSESRKSVNLEMVGLALNTPYRPGTERPVTFRLTYKKSGKPVRKVYLFLDSHPDGTSEATATFDLRRIQTDENGEAHTTLAFGNRPGKIRINAHVVYEGIFITSRLEPNRGEFALDVDGLESEGPYRPRSKHPVGFRLTSIHSGKPIPFAQLTLRASPYRESKATATFKPAQITTDENGEAHTTLAFGNWPGEITIPAIDVAFQYVSFTGLNYPQTLDGREVNLTMGPKDQARLESKRRVHFSLRDSNGSPMRLVRLRLRTSDESTASVTFNPAEITTDQNGDAYTTITFGNTPGPFGIDVDMTKTGVLYTTLSHLSYDEGEAKYEAKLTGLQQDNAYPLESRRTLTFTLTHKQTGRALPSVSFNLSTHGSVTPQLQPDQLTTDENGEAQTTIAFGNQPGIFNISFDPSPSLRLLPSAIDLKHLTARVFLGNGPDETYDCKYKGLVVDTSYSLGSKHQVSVTLTNQKTGKPLPGLRLRWNAERLRWSPQDDGSGWVGTYHPFPPSPAAPTFNPPVTTTDEKGTAHTTITFGNQPAGVSLELDVENYDVLDPRDVYFDFGTPTHEFPNGSVPLGYSPVKLDINFDGKYRTYRDDRTYSYEIPKDLKNTIRKKLVVKLRWTIGSKRPIPGMPIVFERNDSEVGSATFEPKKVRTDENGQAVTYITFEPGEDNFSIRGTVGELTCGTVGPTASGSNYSLTGDFSTTNIPLDSTTSFCEEYESGISAKWETHGTTTIDLGAPVITVKFLDGTDDQIDTMKRSFRAWENLGAVFFRFVESEKAEIRCTFDKDNGKKILGNAVDSSNGVTLLGFPGLVGYAAWELDLKVVKFRKQKNFIYDRQDVGNLWVKNDLPLYVSAGVAVPSIYGVGKHEVGHALGFCHVGKGKGGTPHTDNLSVMWGDGTFPPGGYELSDGDKIAMSNVYGRTPLSEVGKVKTTVDIYGVDDETWPDDDEILDPEEPTELTVYIGAPDSNYQRLATYKWGGEVRVEVDIRCGDIKTTNGKLSSVDMSARVRLFEGIYENTDDLEDEKTIDFTVSGAGATNKEVKVKNSGAFGGDWANITLSFSLSDAPAAPSISTPNSDVNGDGRVDAADLVLVSNYLSHPAPETPRVDIDTNGIVTIADLVSVAQYLGQSTDASAPASVLSMPAGLTYATVEGWIRHARLEDDGSSVFQRGIAKLEYLLTLIIPEKTALLPNYPNPFNPETWIPYHLVEPGDVTITIYSVDGKVVRRLELGHQAAGYYQSKSRAAYWDGRNSVGERVASGLYFYTLTAGDFTATRKMLIRK